MLPEHQSKGIGQKLLAFAEEQARRIDRPALTLCTGEKMTRNIGIYRRYGFVETRRRPNPNRAGWVLVDMEKNLDRMNSEGPHRQWINTNVLTGHPGLADPRIQEHRNTGFSGFASLRPRDGVGRVTQAQERALRMRYLPHTDQDRADMLAKIGVGSIDELFSDIPPAKRLKQPLDLPKHKSELEVSRIMRGLAQRNHAAGDGPFFVGAGAYRHAVPAAVDHIIQRSEFLTSYTPYQPEIAQGTLQYLFEFQTQVANLTGMEVANASMYDGSTATAEAVLMAHRVTRRKKAVLSGGLHPHYRETVETISRMAGDTIVALGADPRGTEDILAAIDDETSCVVVQSPPSSASSSTWSRSPRRRTRTARCWSPSSPKSCRSGCSSRRARKGADIVAGEGQGIGNALNFGGPYVGLFATRQKFIRQMPGRLSGMTVDAEGKRGFVLTLSTREQHIRREKATSNICTNSGLCSLAFTAHMTLLGETGLAQLAEANHARACQLADALAKVPGVEVLNESVLQRVHGEAAGGCGAGRRDVGGRGHHGRRAGFAAGSRQGRPSQSPRRAAR